MIVVLVARRGSQTYAFVAYSFEGITKDVTVPIDPISLPERASEESNVLKTQGNFKSTVYSFTLAEIQGSDGNPIDVSDVRLGLLPDGSRLVSDNIGTRDIYTVDEQEDYLETKFESISLAEGKDSMYFPFEEYNGGNRAVRARRYDGKFSNLVFSRESANPLVSVATLTLYTGKVLVDVTDNE